MPGNPEAGPAAVDTFPGAVPAEAGVRACWEQTTGASTSHRQVKSTTSYAIGALGIFLWLVSLRRRLRYWKARRTQREMRHDKWGPCLSISQSVSVCQSVSHVFVGWSGVGFCSRQVGAEAQGPRDTLKRKAGPTAILSCLCLRQTGASAAANIDSRAPILPSAHATCLNADTHTPLPRTPAHPPLVAR